MQEHLSIPDGLIVFKVDKRELCLDVKFLVAILSPKEKKLYELTFRENRWCVRYDDREYSLVNFVPRSPKKSTNDDNTRIILAEYKNHRCSFFVEKVCELVYRDKGDVNLLEFVPTEDSPGMSGYIKFGQRNLWFLDLRKCLLLSSSTPNPTE